MLEHALHTASPIATGGVVMAKILASAPAKIILFGEHVVVHGKTAIAASLNMRTYALLEETNDGYLRVYLHDKPDNPETKWKLEDLKFTGQLPPLDSPTIHPDILSLAEKLSPADVHGKFTQSLTSIIMLYIMISRGKHKSIKISVRSQVPLSVGLGSSAAFNTAVATALLEYYGHTNFSVGGNSSSDKGNSNSESNNMLINKYAFEMEKVMHGRPSGIDNSTSTYGGIIAFTGGKIDHISSIPPLRIIITNTKVSRNTKLLVQKVGTLCSTHPPVALPLLDSVHQISHTVLDMFRKYNENKLPLGEIEKTLEGLISVNHYILGALGVGHKVLDDIYHLTQKYNFISKTTGAGGGGCIYTLIRTDSDQGQVDDVLKELKANGFDCFPAVIGSPGATIHAGETNFPNNFDNNGAKL